MADAGTRLSLATTTGFMVAAAIVVFILFIFIFALYLHANRCYGANPVSERRRRRRRAIVAEHQHFELDAAAIEAALPSAVFRRPEGSEEGVDCAVCLSELAEGEAARLLPRCEHAFHVECIDMWLYSHSTCPLCRCPVLAAPEKEEAADSRLESSSVSHASYSSSHQEGRSSSSSVSSSWRRQGEVVIEIPRRAAEGLAEEEVMSSPGAAALRSMRRILSCGPREGDRRHEAGASSGIQNADHLVKDFNC